MSKSKVSAIFFFALSASAALFTAPARAEYRCAPPPTHIDRMACDIAREGPDALRHFIQRMRVIESLYFFDYVNEEVLLVWRQLERANEPPLPEQQAQLRP
jgi:hypothetical protein